MVHITSIIIINWMRMLLVGRLENEFMNMFISMMLESILKIYFFTEIMKGLH